MFVPNHAMNLTCARTSVPELDTLPSPKKVGAWQCDINIK